MVLMLFWYDTGNYTVSTPIPNTKHFIQKNADEIITFHHTQCLCNESLGIKLISKTIHAVILLLLFKRKMALTSTGQEQKIFNLPVLLSGWSHFNLALTVTVLKKNAVLSQLNHTHTLLQ
jgi:hypothetical protein